MKCPICKNKDTKVIDSRSLEDGTIIRRRRECLACNFRFSTHEELELLKLTVIKKNKEKEPYNREKIIRGIRAACEKRPVSENDILELISSVEQDIRNLNKEEIESKTIGNLVINYLKDLDEVAYLRFASVYKNFKSIDGFAKELKNLEKDKNENA